MHYKRYYTLDHSFYTSEQDRLTLDFLWNEYWTQTLSSSPIITVSPTQNYEYSSQLIGDLSRKIEQSESSVQRHTSIGPIRKKEESKISKVAQDAARIGSLQGKGLATLMLQNLLFRR